MSLLLGLYDPIQQNGNVSCAGRVCLPPEIEDSFVFTLFSGNKRLGTRTHSFGIYSYVLTTAMIFSFGNTATLLRIIVHHRAHYHSIVYRSWVRYCAAFPLWCCLVPNPPAVVLFITTVADLNKLAIRQQCF